jgi:hypothetical protein
MGLTAQSIVAGHISPILRINEFSSWDGACGLSLRFGSSGNGKVRYQIERAKYLGRMPN